LDHQSLKPATGPFHHCSAEAEVARTKVVDSLTKNAFKTAEAFAPAAISSFFQIHDTEKGTPISDLTKMGAIGGGFGLQKGVKTTVLAEQAKKSSVAVFINSELSVEAKTTLAVVKEILAKTSTKYTVRVKHQIEVPIGMGFGTSAGGALTTGLALSKALEIPITYNQIGEIAHVAEIECQTGLGTVSSLTFCGGCVLVVEAGAPGICQIDRIPITSNYVLVAGYLQTKIPKTILSSPGKKKEINSYGKKTLDAILDEPSLENFMESCWEFAQNAGFATNNIHQLVTAAKKAGAVGAAQNMIGEAVHALVLEENAESVAEAFKQTLPPEQVIVSKIDFQGARLL
jgi:pantoate kinase